MKKLALLLSIVPLLSMGSVFVNTQSEDTVPLQDLTILQEKGVLEAKQVNYTIYQQQTGTIHYYMYYHAKPHRNEGAVPMPRADVMGN